MDPAIGQILSALDEVKSQMKDNDYKVAVEALASLNPPPKADEFILTFVKIIPELEIDKKGNQTINISKEMVQSKFNLSDVAMRHIKMLIANGSIHIDLSQVAQSAKDELERIKRSIYNISSKNTFSQLQDCHRSGSGCIGIRRSIHLCSSVIIVGITRVPDFIGFNIQSDVPLEITNHVSGIRGTNHEIIGYHVTRSTGSNQS